MIIIFKQYCNFLEKWAGHFKQYQQCIPCKTTLSSTRGWVSSSSDQTPELGREDLGTTGEDVIHWSDDS